MRIFLLNPIGKSTPDLFPSFIPIFKRLGHEVVEDINEATCVFFDAYSGVGTYDRDILDRVIVKKLPVIFWDETDFGGMSNERFLNTDTGLKPHEEFLLDCVSEGISHIYFMRKYDKTKGFPKWVYPYEKCLYEDCDFPLATKEELVSRPYDICWIGNTSPQRQNIVNGLVNAGFKMYVHWTNEKGKIPHDEWLDLHRQARAFIESDGGGFSSERPYQLITIGAMIRQRNNQLFAHPWTDEFNCIEIGDSDGVVAQEDINKIKSLTPDQLYDIYLNGIRHINKHYTYESRAKYILEILKENGL
jgi:hypothetical protein